MHETLSEANMNLLEGFDNDETSIAHRFIDAFLNECLSPLVKSLYS